MLQLKSIRLIEGLLHKLHLHLCCTNFRSNPIPTIKRSFV